MSMENNENNIPVNEAEATLIKKLVGVENLFVIFSLRTKLPFAVCDTETFDDEILVFDKPEHVHPVLTRLKEEGNPVEVGVIAQKDRLNFFASLCTMGVNCIVFNGYSDVEERVQLDRVVRTPKGKTPDGQPWIENPSLYLTGVYFMQAVARNVKREETAELTEMREEIVAHYSNGNFLIVFNEQGQLPIMKFPNGDAYQPIFTDMFEAAKFKSDQPFKLGAVAAVKIPGLLAQEAKGIVVNPATICLQLPIIRQAPKQVQPQQAAPVQGTGENAQPQNPAQAAPAQEAPKRPSFHSLAEEVAAEAEKETSDK